MKRNVAPDTVRLSSSNLTSPSEPPSPASPGTGEGKIVHLKVSGQVAATYASDERVGRQLGRAAENELPGRVVVAGERTASKVSINPG